MVFYCFALLLRFIFLFFFTNLYHYYCSMANNNSSGPNVDKWSSEQNLALIDIQRDIKQLQEGVKEVCEQNVAYDDVDYYQNDTFINRYARS